MHKLVFAFLKLFPDNKGLDNSNLHGYQITAQTWDKATKKLSIEFTRPFDVPYDHSFLLQPEKTYILHIMWGAALKGKTTWKPKGMTARLEGPAKFNKGQNWTLPEPPGWDELINSLGSYQSKKRFEKGGSSGAVKTSISMISAVLLVAFGMN